MTELSDLTEFWNVHGNPVYYRAHGRVYKSPHKPKEIWFTIGLGFRNAQIYPDFEPLMRAFTTEEQYNEFTKFLEREFDESLFIIVIYTNNGHMLLLFSVLFLRKKKITFIPCQNSNTLQ